MITPFLVSLTLTQPTATSGGGTLTLVANSGDSFGPLTLEIPGLTAGIEAMLKTGGPGEYTYVRQGVPPGTYASTVRDASPAQLPSFTTEPFTFDEPPAPVRGCTDAGATNFDPLATYEAGTCVYTPVVVEPFFSVPLLQSLRFIVRGGDFETLDNVLFCEQTRAGQQRRPYFFQLVQYDDGPLRVQVLTSYAAVAATVFVHGGSQVGSALALKKVLTLEGPADPLAVVLREDVATGTTQLRAAAGGPLPTSLLGATRLTLAGAAAGTYRLTAAVPGTVASPNDYILLNRPWVAPGLARSRPAGSLRGQALTCGRPRCRWPAGPRATTR